MHTGSKSRFRHVMSNGAGTAKPPLTIEQTLLQLDDTSREFSRLIERLHILRTRLPNESNDFRAYSADRMFLEGAISNFAHGLDKLRIMRNEINNR